MPVEATELGRGKGDWRFVIRPQASLSWQGAKRYLALQAAVSLLVAVPWVIAGLWVVLPFAGGELVAVAAAFYWVLVRLQHIEVVSLRGERVKVERGRKGPEEETELPRAWAQVVLEEPARGVGASRLFLRSHGYQTELGAGLSNEERRYLGETLVRALDRGQRLARRGG